jgi:hypothetical protein
MRLYPTQFTLRSDCNRCRPWLKWSLSPLCKGTKTKRTVVFHRVETVFLKSLAAEEFAFRRGD